MQVRVGQRWEIYSLRARRWAAAEVLNIESRVARLKYLQHSEFCYFRTEDMLIFKDRFRLVGPDKRCGLPSRNTNENAASHAGGANEPETLKGYTA